MALAMRVRPVRGPGSATLRFVHPESRDRVLGEEVSVGVADRVHATVAARWRAERQSFVDLRGHVFLELPWMIIDPKMPRRRPLAGTEPTLDPFADRGSLVTRALLEHPRRVPGVSGNAQRSMSPWALRLACCARSSTASSSSASRSGARPRFVSWRARVVPRVDRAIRLDAKSCAGRRCADRRPERLCGDAPPCACPPQPARSCGALARGGRRDGCAAREMGHGPRVRRSCDVVGRREPRPGARVAAIQEGRLV